MHPTQWISCSNFYMQPLADKLELLLARREELFEQEQRLFVRQTELSEQKQDLFTRRTIHELQCRLFWLQLRNPAFAEECEYSLVMK